jgi:hypothetical protein
VTTGWGNDNDRSAFRQGPPPAGHPMTGWPRTRRAARSTKHPIAMAFAGLGALIVLGALWAAGIAAVILASSLAVYGLWEVGRYLIG